MAATKDITYTFGNLSITRTRIEGATTGVFKNIEVSRFNGEYWEILPSSDQDHQRVIIMALNKDNEQTR
jgi:hypothetical protein